MSNAPDPFGNYSNNPYAAPPPTTASAFDLGTQQQDEESQIALGLKASLGARVAGVVLILNAVLVLVEMIAVPATATGSMPRSPLPAIIDAVIGTSLAMGNAKWRRWAIVRVVLGAVLIGGISLASGQVIVAVLQLMVSGGLLLLLLGNPSRLRIGAGCAIYGVYMLLAILGLFTTGEG